MPQSQSIRIGPTRGLSKRETILDALPHRCLCSSLELLNLPRFPHLLRPRRPDTFSTHLPLLFHQFHRLFHWWFPFALQNPSNTFGAYPELFCQDRRTEFLWIKPVKLAKAIHGFARELFRWGPSTWEVLLQRLTVFLVFVWC